MAKGIADVESSVTGNQRGHERANENLRELLDHGGRTANIGNGSTEPGDPAGTRDQKARPMESVNGAEGGHGGNLDDGGSRAGSRYGETTGLVGYDIGSGKDPQEMNTPPSAPRNTGRTEGHHEESGTETSRNKG